MKSFVFLLAITTFFSLLAYFQSSDVTDVLNNNYRACTVNSTNIVDLTKTKVNKTAVMKCIRNSHTAVKYFHSTIKPKLEYSPVTSMTNLINDLCGMFKNGFLLLLPAMIFITFCQDFYNFLSDKDKSIRDKSTKTCGTCDKRIIVTFILSMILCCIWNIFYRHVISIMIREFYVTNASGHIIIIPLILASLMSNMDTVWTKSNIMFFMNFTVFVCVLINGVYTCLYFHTFFDVLVGSMISVVIGCVILYQ